VSASSEAFALLSLIQATQSTDELSDVLGRVAAQFGCTSFAVSSHEIGADGADVHLLLDRLPKAFQARYVSEHYGKVSPVARHSRESDEPFLWHDLQSDTVGDPKGFKVIKELAEAGLADGFSVPVHLPEGRRGTVSFCGPTRLEFSEHERLALHALALAAHAQLRHLHQPDVPVVQSPRLTAREREILQWTAAGKTADETARILSISVRTVEYHLLNASRKLNTMNRTHTVVEALRSKQLSL
jgi:LuxR family quorum sensing-dependent transcriptional regulator